jgi:hypothetical protein
MSDFFAAIGLRFAIEGSRSPRSRLPSGAP